MERTITLTPVVARALEERRRQLDSELDPYQFAASVQNEPVERKIYQFKQRCRELGALDEACTASGITEYVSEQNREES